MTTQTKEQVWEIECAKDLSYTESALSAMDIWADIKCKDVTIGFFSWLNGFEYSITFEDDNTISIKNIGKGIKLPNTLDECYDMYIKKLYLQSKK